MAKPLPRQVSSDDCVVTVNGEPCTPHEGEFVWLFQGQSMSELRGLSKLMGLQTAMDVAKGDTDAGTVQELLEGINAAFDDICKMLAPRVVRWDWTDLRGDPLPQPDGTPGPLARLDTQELMWLLTAAKGETPQGRGEG